jgi:hypothetical protein
VGKGAKRKEHSAESDAEDFAPSVIDCSHLITLSALASTFGGMIRPICFAVFRLIIAYLIT